MNRVRFPLLKLGYATIYYRRNTFFGNSLEFPM